MKSFGKYILSAGLALSLIACSSDFLETSPKNALSTLTAWSTPSDADKFLVGCYDGWESAEALLYLDCMSDFGFNFHTHEGFRQIANGSLTASNPGSSFYDFTIIGRCNNLLDNIDKVKFTNEAQKKDIVAQAKFIRAYRYFSIVWAYGKAPIIEHLYEKAEQAKVPANTEEEVKAYIYKELEEAAQMINKTPAARGRIALGAVLALHTRVALYYGDWAKAKQMAEDLMGLNQYSLESNYADLFTVAGQDSKEIILAVQYLLGLKTTYVIATMYNNADGGWSSMVPTHNLVDTYEMANGMSPEETSSGYDATKPFKNRDPRMAMTILYPGADYTSSKVAKIYNTLDAQINGQSNENLVSKTSVNNISKTGLTWRKYNYPEYDNMWETNVSPIVFRYAEVLLSWAEAANELDFNANKAEIYAKLNQVRQRAGMPVVDQNKYNTQATLRELIRRERSVEFAGEGLRRADIVRWKDQSGKLVAERVLNAPLTYRTGTVNMSASVAAGERATVDTQVVKIEDRMFKPHMRYLPLPQNALDKNPKLTPTSGY